ncbi:MAG: hypothetical protein RBS39_03500 [Phycisphaerales bacterium]|nr:hypothetical protein [Phycisphaerales bacterium]
MGQLAKLLENVRTHLGQLGLTQKMLIGALGVILAMTLLLVAQLSAKPSMETLFAADGTGDQVAILRAAGIEAKVSGGEVVVPAGNRHAALATLGQSGSLPGDSTILFKNLIDKQSWQHSRTQNEQLYMVALQNELSRVISHFTGISSATVLIDAPQPNGLGGVVREPTASATVFTSGGGELPQKTVDAIAHLIASARSGLKLEHVRVIDGSSGRQRQATDESQLVATTYLEHAAAVENAVRRKLLEHLAYIPGVTVTVTAQVDVTRVRSETSRYLDKGAGSVSMIGSSNGSTKAQGGGSKGAEPGPRSNVAMDVSRPSSSGGSTYNESQTDETFDNRFGTQVEQVVDPRGMPTFLAASINIPSGFVAGTLKTQDGAAPADADVARAFDDMRTAIEAGVKPHLRTRSPVGDVVEGAVAVAMIPLDAPAIGTARAGMFGGGGGGGVTSMLSMEGGLIEKGLLAAMALVSMGLMVTMVKKAGKKAPLPTAEELVGLPPQLDTGSDLVGEADESDAPMAGIEVDDQDVRAQKMMEQVTEMVKQEPDSAARLLSRWMETDSDH